jgi:hypothetical protein
MVSICIASCFRMAFISYSKTYDTPAEVPHEPACDAHIHLGKYSEKWFSSFEGKGYFVRSLYFSSRVNTTRDFLNSSEKPFHGSRGWANTQVKKASNVTMKHILLFMFVPD